VAPLFGFEAKKLSHLLPRAYLVAFAVSAVLRPKLGAVRILTRAGSCLAGFPGYSWPGQARPGQELLILVVSPAIPFPRVAREGASRSYHKNPGFSPDSSPGLIIFLEQASRPVQAARAHGPKRIIYYL